MPAESQFFPEHHLLYERLYGTTPSEEIGARQLGHLRILAQTRIPNHILIDLRAVEGTRLSLGAMKGILVPLDSPKLLWIVFIVPPDNPIMPFIVSVTTQIARRGGRIKMVHTFNGAIGFLENRDWSLDLSGLMLEIENKFLPGRVTGSSGRSRAALQA